MSAILFLFARNSWESSERFTNQEFFDKLFQTIAANNLAEMDILELSSMVRSIGSLAYVNKDVVKIIAAFKE